MNNKIKAIFSSKEFISTLSTGIICTSISLGITYNIENKNREINLRPYLEITLERVKDKENHFGIIIRNTGKGPAIINEGFIKAEETINIKDMNYNFWDSLLPKLGVYSTQARSLGKPINICNKLFFEFDYIPTMGSSIKDGEDKSLISYSTQYDQSLVGQRAPNDELYQKIYTECRETLEKMIADGRLSIKLEYKSLNGNEYDTGEQKVQFSF
ncbi:hypothetical protein [uncultured Haemophilus sp.]|jgi:hypothetical protein|uniref:hypothetical protein n=1 Tax=uncultured Haemophilus sp. TaxID=237779 RepID=UPI0025D20ED1|nr:hypothetical protein [uncultured Haemophilus sp.]